MDAPARTPKDDVRSFWQAASCGEKAYAKGATLREQLDEQARQRYLLDHMIHGFAHFEEGRDKEVLEIGVGMGADHLEWAKAGPRALTGIDFTPRAVDFTRARMVLYGLHSILSVADAECLPFEADRFDLVYSWGVLHHTPNTPQAINEVHRVLKPGGIARIMIYHKYSMVGYMLWVRYALMRGAPRTSLAHIYANYLESPGTKAYSKEEARQLLARFSTVRMTVSLGEGDLLLGGVGQRHKGPLLSLAKTLYPRWFVRRFLAGHGGGLMIEAVK
jgi:ubiquinone/menaquinone biosynthesis C-methylase UbiE